MESRASVSDAVSPLDGAIFRDPDCPLAGRVRDLIGRMSLAEKIGQIVNDARAIPRLGIPAYNAWSEGLHGVGQNGRATVFPQAIGMAATWDTDLIQRVAAAIGDEARAKYHEALRSNGSTQIYQGLNLWAPNINIYRDPRWGRGQETWGEDPYLTSMLGAAFVRGLQGNHPRYLKVAACAKHFAVHSGPEQLRHGLDAQVSPRDLHETYLPAFHALVEAGAEAVIGAYNRTNGEPCCDLECGGSYKQLDEALARGLIAEADIDWALARVLTTRFKLGMFDPPERVPYAATPLSVVGCAAHWELAYQAAVKSVVLLKNRGNLLPIGPQVRSIRVLGPTAADVGVLLGGSYGLNGELITILEGIVDRLPEGVGLEYRPGCQLAMPSTSRQDWLFEPHAQPDVLIACMGLTPLLESEEGDAVSSTDEGVRADIALPAVQAEFVRRLAATGAKVVLVLTGGGPIALGDLADLVDAIVFVWYPGQAGGAAVADVLFGQVVPSGKLPITFPRSVDDLPPFDDYRMAGRTYRYATREPLYPFGFGLSYTSFDYRDLRLDREYIDAGAGLSLAVTLANTGSDVGEEVVQVYVSALDAPGAPLAYLVGFRRVELNTGEQQTLRFEIPPAQLMLVGADGVRRLVPGRYRVTVGGCAPRERGVALGAPAPASAEFAIE